MSGSSEMIDEHELRSAVSAATKAPSSHNTQPWLFEFKDDVISLIADRTRALPANDPFDRELTISCGSALFNLRAAIAAMGRTTSVDLLPDASNPDLLARVQVEAGKAGDEAELAAGIDLRRTSRERFEETGVSAELLTEMQAAAEKEGAWIEVVSDGKRRTSLAELIAEGDQRQFADPTWRRELASWMHPRRSGDGLAMPGFSRPIAKLVVSVFDIGKTTGAKDEMLAETAPEMAVVGTSIDLDEDWMRAGQALQRSLLIAAGDGIQAGYLNQPCQVAELRPKLRDLLTQSGYPQVVMRLGRPESPPKPAPRRDVDQVLTT